MSWRSPRWIVIVRHFRRLPPAAYVLVVLTLVLAFVAPRFLTIGNLTNVARNAAILALAACGQAIIIITGGIDFSSGSAVALVSVVMVLAVSSLNFPVALAAGVLAALAVGVVNGTLVARFDVPPFLVTLGMLTAAHGLASVLVGGIPLEAPPGAGFSWMGRGSVAGIPAPVVFGALAFLVLEILLRWTVLGRFWFLIGASPSAARAAGVPIRSATFCAYTVASAFVATAGLVLTARVNSGQPNLFPSLPFEAIAACAIGGLPLTGGSGQAVQVLMGVLIVAALENGLRLLNFSSDIQLMFIGVLTVVSVLLQTVSWRPGGRRPASATGIPAQPRGRVAIPEKAR